MPTITHDSQSFLLDGRRIWIVSGQIDYFRMPRAEWADRIRACSEAGLNTIVVRCPWGLHEPRKGKYVFEGDADVAEFVRLIGAQGMWCILRPGPFVGSDLDLGGMPSWLLSNPDLVVRTGNAPFLEAVSSYLGKLLAHLSLLSSSKGGPIILSQVEHEWYCGNAIAAQSYLLEIARFIREHDFDIPLLNTNNLWQRREETIDTWSGRDHMLVHLRQLRTIHSSTPLFVGDFHLGEYDSWNTQRQKSEEPGQVLRRLTQVLAAGAQFNLSPFFGGTNFGFSGCRVSGELERFLTTSADANAPLDESGCKTETYYALRKICTFASQFSKVHAALEPSTGAAVLALEHTHSSSGKAGPSVIHLSGDHGEVVYVIEGESGSARSVDVLLSDGTVLPVHLGKEPVAWCLMNTHLCGRASLNWTNLNAFATNNKNLLVLYGVSGQMGLISINHSEIELKVPRGQKPHIEVTDDLTIIVCNTSTIDSTHLRGDTVYLGVEGFDAEGAPIPFTDVKKYYTVGVEGKLKSYTVEPVVKTRVTIRIADWCGAGVDAHIDGTAPRYATIDGPMTQEQCNAGSGYGFVRIAFPKRKHTAMKLMMPDAGDRIHLYLDGKFNAIVGHGPGATDEILDVTFPEDQHTIVALVDNLGRYAGGNDMNECKGIVNHFHEVVQFDPGTASIVNDVPLRAFDLRPFIEGLHSGAATTGENIEWHFEHRRKALIIMEISVIDIPAIISVNNEPIAFYSGGTGKPKMRLRLSIEGNLRRGKNILRLSPMMPIDSDTFLQNIRFHEVQSTPSDDKATWAFAKWEQPQDKMYQVINEHNCHDLEKRPAWFKTTFTVNAPPSLPLWFEPNGLTKGQVYLNGYNLGRYFVETHDGEAIPPQKRILLPTPWLHIGKKGTQENVITIFDEHGHSPIKSKIVQHTTAF